MRSTTPVIVFGVEAGGVSWAGDGFCIDTCVRIGESTDRPNRIDYIASGGRVWDKRIGNPVESFL